MPSVNKTVNTADITTHSKAFCQSNGTTNFAADKPAFRLSFSIAFCLSIRKSIKSSYAQA